MVVDKIANRGVVVKKLVVFGLLVLANGMTLADQNYYSADQSSVTDSWLQRHYDGYPVQPSGQPAQNSQSKEQESSVAKYYSGKPADEEVVVQPAHPVANSAKPVVHAVQTGAKPTDSVADHPHNTETHEEKIKPLVHTKEASAEFSQDSVEEKKHIDDSEQRARKGALPGGMGKGIDDVEEGLSELKDYTKDVTSNIKEKGLRGFLDVPPEQQAKGRAIGEKIGRGIRDVMDEVGKDMVGNR